MTTPDHTIPVSGAETSVVVSQADREVYVRICPDMASLILSGELDTFDQLQVIARHRLTSTPQAASAIPDGWKLVPVEATDEMVDGGCLVDIEIYPTNIPAGITAANSREARMIWSEMLAASPECPQAASAMPEPTAHTQFTDGAKDRCRCGKPLDFNGIEPRETLICECGTGHAHPECRGAGSVNQRANDESGKLRDLIPVTDAKGFVTLHEPDEDGNPGDLVASVWRADWLLALTDGGKRA